MKITKKGKIPSEEITSECRQCGTEFVFAKGEAKTSFYDSREGEWIHTVSCPLCGVDCFGYT